MIYIIIIFAGGGSALPDPPSFCWEGLRPPRPPEFFVGGLRPPTHPGDGDPRGSPQGTPAEVPVALGPRGVRLETQTDGGRVFAPPMGRSHEKQNLRVKISNFAPLCISSTARMRSLRKSHNFLKPDSPLPTLWGLLWAQMPILWKLT